MHGIMAAMRCGYEMVVSIHYSDLSFAFAAGKSIRDLWNLFLLTQHMNLLVQGPGSQDYPAELLNGIE